MRTVWDRCGLCGSIKGTGSLPKQLLCKGMPAAKKSLSAEFIILCGVVWKPRETYLWLYVMDTNARLPTCSSTICWDCSSDI